MAPTIKETVIQDVENEKPLTGEEVVISGISGNFPKSESVKEFMDNLYNNVDMVTQEREFWIDHDKLPKYYGKVKGMSKFDAQFFKVHYKQARCLDPMCRKFLENAYGAIYDSGINPTELRGKKVAVYVGTSSSDLERTISFERFAELNGFALTGICRSMYANRLSYGLDLKGPSYSIDQSCSSVLECLEHAYRSIRNGDVEAAIIGGTNYYIHPHVTLGLKKAGLLCVDGKTKCFDKKGDGFVRADTINTFFLQKSKDAKRVYSEVCHIYESFYLMENEIFLPLREVKFLSNFFNEAYSKTKILPEDIEYIEAFAAGFGQPDFNELEAIGKVFGKKKTINVGSVKSNMGNAGTASGGSSLTKLCLAYHKGIIPANLHYENPPDHIPEVRDGKVEIVTTNTPFSRGLTALNSFSHTGSNIHVILKGHYKKKVHSRYLANIPYLVFASGRQEDCVSKIFNNFKNNTIDPEQIGLLHNIHSTDIAGHMCRGYSILDKSDDGSTVSLSENIEYYPATTVPIWFVYSGMGSQWATMGAELMRIPIFAAAIQRCHNVLEPKGVDIIKILTENNNAIYDNILHSFVGIAAVQIGLTDILNELGIVPDNIIGHSVGELGCAYADGCFTAEEMILAAYSRGLVSIQTPFVRGSMAAVGLGYESVLPLCPPEIEVACHNSFESSTLSGPADVMKQFVAELKTRGVFAKEVPCSNIAYHSRYIADAGPQLLKYLNEVITDPKPRSKKWVSTSVPQDKWNEPAVQYSSAEYHTNNLLSAVFFEETSKIIPSNAIVIEIAPHGLLQAIIKRSLPNCTHVPLTRRGHSEPVKHLLESLGRLYQAGLNPKVQVLYPQIEFPVSTETQLLSHLVGWEHSEDWALSAYDENYRENIKSIVRKIVFSIYDDDFNYFIGHIRNGHIIIPEAALIVFVWETLAMSKGLSPNQLSVIFRNIKFHEEVVIQKELPLTLVVMIQKGSHDFEVSFKQSTIVSGNIADTNNKNFRSDLKEFCSDEVKLTTEDIYKIMNLKGCIYKNEFQSLLKLNMRRDMATVNWSNKWVPFIDSLLQFNIFAKDHEGVSIPTFISMLKIHTDVHYETLKTDEEKFYCHLVHDTALETTRCGGVEMDGLILKEKEFPVHIPDVFLTKTFVPHFIVGKNNLQTVLHIIIQIIKENIKKETVKLIEFTRNSSGNVMPLLIKNVSKYIPSSDFHVLSIQVHNDDDLIAQFNRCNASTSDVIVVRNFFGNKKNSENLYRVLSKDVFVIALEQDFTSFHPYHHKLFTTISASTVDEQVVVLLKKKIIEDDENMTYISIVHDNTFSWVPKVKSELKKSKRVVLVSERQPYCGLSGFLQNMLKEYFDKLSLIIVDDYHAPSFMPSNKIFNEQLHKNLRINILNKGKWGGYYYIPSETSVKLQNLKLTITHPGDLDSLTWMENLPKCVKSNQVQVCYASPTQADVLQSVGISKFKGSSSGFGLDFSGIDVNGDKVMGLSFDGTISSTVETIPELTWPVPKHWSLEDAATVPFPFIMAYYCLVIKYTIQKGSSVFVTGGAGALGQAVISLCTALDCTVYTTVSDIKKKRFLLNMFPKLREDNIGFSRDEALQNMVIYNSKNKCCDIAINCSSGLVREATMKTVGHGGYFYDLSNIDMIKSNNMGMIFLKQERNYVGLNLSQLFKPENKVDFQSLQSLIAEGIAKGIVRPLSRVVYSPVDVTKAFRLLSATRHRGRVLIKMNDPLVLNQGLQVTPKITYSHKESHIVICDDKDLGIELADRLVKNNARNIVMHFKNKIFNGYLETKLKSWKSLGAVVNMSYGNINTEEECKNLIKKSSTLCPVGGIFIVLNATDDQTNKPLLEQEKFVNDFRKTSLSVINLDVVTRNTCPELRHFVVLTRVSQNVTVSYNNAVIERICHFRNEIGLPALVLRVELSEKFNNQTSTQSLLRPLTLPAVLNGLDISLKLKQNNITMFNLETANDTNFMEKLARILGLKSIDEVDGDTTLGEFLINETNIAEIKSAIKELYALNFSDEKLNQMSIASLKGIKQKYLRSNTDFDSGLGTFYSYIEEDDHKATNPMIVMPTLVKSKPEIIKGTDPKDTYLFLIPGFEGHHAIYSSICKRLKVNARVFQLGPDVTTESIPKIAEDILKFMKGKFEFGSKFYLMGYSFGVNVALELARLLEKNGHVGILYCLDSSPVALRAQMDAYLGNLSAAELQNTILEHIFHLMTGHVKNNELRKALETLEQWNDKIEICIQKLKGVVSYSNQYKRAIFDTAYQRIILARKYEPDFKLKSQIVLMKGIPHPNQAELPDDYDLSKYSIQPIEIYKLATDHALAPQDCRVSNIINTFIDPDVLEEFKKKNICESYTALRHTNMFSK